MHAAKAEAGDKDVSLLGDGISLFGELGARINLERIETAAFAGETHLRHRVVVLRQNRSEWSKDIAKLPPRTADGIPVKLPVAPNLLGGTLFHQPEGEIRMPNYRHKTRHDTVSVDALDIFCRHAGDPDGPAILLLHVTPAGARILMPHSFEARRLCSQRLVMPSGE